MPNNEEEKERKESTKYKNLLVDSILIQTKAIKRLDAFEVDNSGTTIANQIAAEIPKWYAARAKNKAKLFAIIASDEVIQPPTGADYAKVKSIVEKLDAQISNARIAKSVLDAGTEIIKVWNKLNA